MKSRVLGQKKERRQPSFSRPETLTGYTKGALLEELVERNVLDESDIQKVNDRLELSGLNKIYQQLTGSDREFRLKKEFFRVVAEEGVFDREQHLTKNQFFTREGLAVVADRLTDIEEVEL